MDQGNSANVPRYAPQERFPAYAYVPGKFPHPVSDVTGHSYGRVETPRLLDSDTRLVDVVEFRFAVDLFNFGYYWEAHESWEQLWHAAGHQSPRGTFLKGLIKLAAAGVKLREGVSAGAQRHARRAIELVAEHEDIAEDAGVPLALLLQLGNEVANNPERWINTSPEVVAVVMPWPIRLE